MEEKKIVAIASSTGGPKALQMVVPFLPENLDAPVLIVQHMPKGFTASFADRLNQFSKMRVKEAEDGEPLENGVVYIAQGGTHMNVRSRKNGKSTIHYSDEPPRQGVKPCANYLFESLAYSEHEKIICVVMTGMGADGTEGILHLKERKQPYVVTQDKDSCVVYGMPGSAVHAKLSDATVKLEEIAKTITTYIGTR